LFILIEPVVEDILIIRLKIEAFPASEVPRQMLQVGFVEIIGVGNELPLV